MYIMYHNECLQKLDTSGEMRGMQYLAQEFDAYFFLLLFANY